jgi:hypothetical protein
MTKDFLREDSKMLEYISAPEAAKKWGTSERRVQKLCEENRIPGAFKFSRMWLIPTDAEKPKDMRIKNR